MDFINIERELMDKKIEISETYDELSKYELSKDLIPVITELKNDCKSINNSLYFYLFDIMLADIYIKENELDDALELMLKDFELTSDSKLNDINISILERIIYVYITKQFFQSALTYALLKKKYFDNPTNDIINRWYLEMAYIHEALGEKNRALVELTSILENEPDDELTLTVLCNITKLFIDEGNIKEALSSLSDCFTLSFKLQDEKSSKYCEYLRAKIYRLQKEFNKALKTFNTLFNDLNTLEEDNFNYLNEYIVLLSETNSYNEAKKLCEKFIDKVNESNDLYNKKLFYENYLRVRCNLVTKQKNSFDYLFDIIKKLENEIIKNNDSKINEIKDTEISYEIKNESKKTLDDINNIVNEINKVNYDNTRDYLMNYSKVIDNYCGVNECLYLIFSENNVNIIPTFMPDTYGIKSYSYKNNRLYERTLNYDDLENTVIINLLNDQEEVYYDFTDTPCKVVDPVFKKSYVDMQFKYLLAIPLIYKDSCYGCCVYLSKSKDITSGLEKVSLSLGNKILEKALINIYNNQNIYNQKGLIDAALNGVCLNIFYQNIDSKKIFVPEELNELLKLKNTEISFDDYYELVDVSDKLKYQDKLNAIKNKEGYKVEYHLNIDGNTIAILEQANPYNDEYYYGTISNVDITKKLDDFVEIATVSLKDDFNNDIKLLNEKVKDDSIYNFICFKVSLNNSKSNLNIDNISIIKEITNILTMIFKSKVYLFNDIFVVINEQKTYSKYVKEAIKLLNKVFYVDNILVKLTIKEIMLSYPKQFNNLDEAYDLITYLYDSNNVFDGKNKFDSKNYNEFIDYKTLNDCVYQNIIKNTVSNNYIEFFENEKYLLALPVINGYDGFIDSNKISYKLKTDLEVKIIENTINEKKEDVFVNVGIDSLNNILVEKKLDEDFRSNKISFIIDNKNQINGNNINDVINVFKQITECNHDIYIDYHILDILPLNIINNNLIKGVYNVDCLDYISLFNKKLSVITGSSEINGELFDKVYKIKIN